MTREYDLIVAGASFAGLACARAAAARGLSVLVLERKPDPGASPRTTGILVQEAAAALGPPAAFTRRIGGVRLYAPSLRCIDLESPGYDFLATDTPGLLRWLAAEAEAAGAEVLCGTEYRGGRRGGGYIVLAELGLRSRFLAGADGARSRVAKDFGLGLNRRFLTGIEVEFEGIRGLDEERLHCFLDSRLAPGYLAWIVPGVAITQVGLACRGPIGSRLDSFTTRARTLADWSGARAVGRRGGLIPVGGAVRPFALGNVILAGDAAGLVSPLTAGGIHTALESGRRAGEAIAAYLIGGGPHPERALRREYPRFIWKQLLRAALDTRPPNRLLDLAFALPPFRALARSVFFHHRGWLRLYPRTASLLRGAARQRTR